MLVSSARKRVLLTGADGFTGVYARAELEAAGYSVTGCVIGAPGVDEVTLDITSLDECRRVMEAVRPDYLMHLAGISFVQHADAAAFYNVNVIGTTNLLQAIVDAGLSPLRLLIASSANVYGNASEGTIDEEHMPAPVNHYAVSKLAMEHMVRTWSDRLPVVITRPFNYTGIGQAGHFLVPKIVDHFRRRAPLIELGNLDVERDFSDVRTVAEAYRKLLEQDCAGQTLNICSGTPYSLRAILGAMEEICGHRMEVRVNPAFVRANEVRVLVGSNRRLHSIVGQLDNARAFPETLRWMAAA